MVRTWHGGVHDPNVTGSVRNENEFDPYDRFAYKDNQGSGLTFPVLDFATSNVTYAYRFDHLIHLTEFLMFSSLKELPDLVTN